MRHLTKRISSSGDHELEDHFPSQLVQSQNSTAPLYQYCSPDGACDLGNLNGLSGFMLQGEAAGDFSGYSVSSGRDVNGDGLNDMLVGAPGDDFQLIRIKSDMESKVEEGKTQSSSGFLTRLSKNLLRTSPEELPLLHSQSGNSLN